MQSHEENRTWKLTKLPERQHLLDNKWVYRIKTDENGSPTNSKPS